MLTTTAQREPLLRRLATGFKRLDHLTQLLLVAFLVAGLATAVVVLFLIVAVLAG